MAGASKPQLVVLKHRMLKPMTDEIVCASRHLDDVVADLKRSMVASRSTRGRFLAKPVAAESNDGVACCIA